MTSCAKFIFFFFFFFCFQYESEAPVKKAPPTSLSSMSLKDQAKEQAKDSRRSSRSKPLRKKKSGSITVDTPGSDDVAKELGGKPEKGEGQGGEEQEVWSQEDEGGGKVPEVSEDVRKSEDSLAVINRQAEAGDEKVLL